jgi:hypothetical protein
MGGSAAESPTPSEAQRPPGGLRASDAERDEVATRLKDEFAAGRLSHDTFLHRMNAVLEARQHGDLSPLVADLPSQPRPQAQPPSQRKPQSAPQPQPQPRTAVPAQGGGRTLADRFRDAWWRISGSTGDGRRGDEAGQKTAVPAAAGAGRVPTMGMRRSADVLQPVPLEFPRGSGEEFSIGRDASCDLSIADMTVSRRHATLQRTQDGWLLTDLESTNGTRVNGWRVRGKVKVTPGDLVSFGNAEYGLC